MLKHTDDDGDLSVFTSGEEILFACRKGHYWMVTGTPHEAPKPEAETDQDFELVVERFGPTVRRALGVRREV